VADSDTEATIAKGLVELAAAGEMILELELLEGATQDDEAGSDQVDEDEEGGGGLQVDVGDGSTQVEVEVGGTHSEVGGGGGGVQVEVGGGGVQVEVGGGGGEGDGSAGAWPSNHQVIAITPAPSSAYCLKSWMSVYAASIP